MINKLLIGIVLVVVVALIGFFISTLDMPEPLDDDEVEEYVNIAEEWIRENAKTFTERGGSQLEHIRTVELEEGVYEIAFEFEAAFAGYGPVDEDEMAAQVITPHTVVVIVEDGEVVSVITDEEYDEMEGREVEAVEEIDEDMVTIDVYFVTVEDGMEGVSAVTREFPVPQDIKVYALNELLEGPTSEEEAEGYSTAIDEETTLNSLSIEEGVAYADFSAELDASGSATVMMIRDQIERTLLQFETVDEVVISIEGETEEILQP